MKIANLENEKMFAELGLKLGENKNVKVWLEQPTRSTEKVNADYCIFAKYEDSEGRRTQDLLGVPDKLGNITGLNLKAWIGSIVSQHPELEGTNLTDIVNSLLKAPMTCTVYVTENTGANGKTYKNNSLRKPIEVAELAEFEEVILEN